MLRLFFRYKLKLLNSLCLSAVRILVRFLHTATGLELMPGVMAVIQTFGDRINFHPHIHVLMTEGGTALFYTCWFGDSGEFVSLFESLTSPFSV